MILKILSVILLSCICAVMYRCGGSGSYPRYFRPLGVGLSVLLAGLVLFPHNLLVICLLVASSGASAGLSTTYFACVNKWLGKPKEDKDWFNWLLVGVAMSLALFPAVFATGSLLGFALRSIVLTAGIVLWSEYQGNAVKEELGRGFLIVATMLLFLIP